jgi:hypothetical protein
MRPYQPNLRHWVGRSDFVDMIKRKLNPNDRFPMTWKTILLAVYCSTKNNLKDYYFEN